MKLKDFISAASNAQLIGVFKIAIKRAAFTFIANAQSTTEQKAWATRARFTFKDERSDWYASLVLEGALNESEEFRAAVQTALDTGDPPPLTDEQFIAIVNVWVARFVAAGI